MEVAPEEIEANETIVKQLLHENDQLQKEIWQYQHQIRLNREKIEQNNKEISTKCDHELVRDYEGSMYEKSTYKCAKCGLYPQYYRYY